MESMDRPTVLVVGEDDRMREALLEALERHGVLAEPCTRDEAVAVARVTAPDLVLLIGDAVEDEGAAVRRALAADPSAATMPVVLLSDAPPPQEGAPPRGVLCSVGRVATSASTDAMAREIVALAGRRGEPDARRPLAPVVPRPRVVNDVVEGDAENEDSSSRPRRRAKRAVDPLAATELGLPGDARTFEPPRPAVGDPSLDERVSYRPPTRVPSKQPTMTLGTVSAKGGAADHPEDEEIESAMSSRATIAMGSVAGAHGGSDGARTPSEPPPGELPEIDAIAMPGMLTPPSSIGVALVPLCEPSELGLDTVTARAPEPPPSVVATESIGHHDETPRDARPLPRAPEVARAPASGRPVWIAAAIATVGMVAAIVGIALLVASARGAPPPEATTRTHAPLGTPRVEVSAPALADAPRAEQPRLGSGIGEP